MPNLSLPPPAAAAPLGEGQLLGVWRLTQPLPDGEDAHAGQWYGAHHARATEQRAAVLVLDRNDQGAGVMLRYADQAGDLARLQHPCIAVPSDSGVTPDAHPYLIVEGDHGAPLLPQLPGLTLHTRIELLVQLCEALRSAHQQGWLLAELDPAMIWLTGAGELRLLGLGLARIPDPQDPFDRGVSLGASPAFVAPEQRAGEPPNLATEVYGLGALARLLVCGWEPMPKGPAPRRGSCASAWPTLPPAQRVQLDQLLLATMAEMPANRPAGAEALADELRAWLSLSPQADTQADTQALKHPRSQATRTPKPASTAGQARDAPTAAPRKIPRKGWLWLSVAAALMLLALTARLIEPRTATAGSDRPSIPSS